MQIAAKLVGMVTLSFLAAAQAQESGISLSDEVRAACDSQGGCALLTKEKYEEEMQRAYQAGVEAAVRALAKKAGEDAKRCWENGA
jgi:predicted hydrolase (HD superfamily)